ncbi:MAG: hypothetical protein RQ862_01930 [Candidatus Caldarchaeales archaeon]|jgi:hypothetical protein|nr:hypothetical protein [Candidatus Caldarchaeales archaeon]
MKDSLGTMTKILKIIAWLRDETQKGNLKWEMKQNGMAEVVSKGYTFRLIAAEVEVPEERKIEVPSELGAGRTFSLRKVSQLFVLRGDILIMHIASFLHPLLERELSSLADVVVNQIAQHNEERLNQLLVDLGIVS